MGCVAAEANHANDKELQKKLDRLFERMEDVLQSTRTRTTDPSN